MSTYTPDRWVIVKIQAVGYDTYYRILASWYGGYTQGDSWKLSSGIEKSFDYDNYYEIPNTSGSTYICHKNAYGMSGYTRNIFANFEKDSKEQGILFELVDKDFIPLLEPAGMRPSIVQPRTTVTAVPIPLSPDELKELDF